MSRGDTADRAMGPLVAIEGPWPRAEVRAIWATYIDVALWPLGGPEHGVESW